MLPHSSTTLHSTQHTHFNSNFTEKLQAELELSWYITTIQEKNGFFVAFSGKDFKLFILVEVLTLRLFVSDLANILPSCAFSVKTEKIFESYIFKYVSALSNPTRCLEKTCL